MHVVLFPDTPEAVWEQPGVFVFTFKGEKTSVTDLPNLAPFPRTCPRRCLNFLDISPAYQGVASTVIPCLPQSHSVANKTLDFVLNQS